MSGWVRDRNDRDRKLVWLISPTYRTNNNQLIQGLGLPFTNFHGHPSIMTPWGVPLPSSSGTSKL